MRQLFPSFLLMAAQLPGPYAAVSAALLVALSGAALLFARTARISLSRVLLIAAAAGAILVVYGAQTYAGLGARWITATQIVTFLVAAGVVASCSRDRWLPRIAFFVLALNFLLTLSYFTGMQEVLWSENGDTHRFRSYFDEPAEAAIMYSICYAVIVSAQPRTRTALISAALYVLLVAISQSMSGVLLAIVLLTVGLVRGDVPVGARRHSPRRSWRRSFVPICVLIGGVAAAIVWVSSSTELYIGNRVSNFLDGGNDGSAQLRFLSPFQIANEVYTNERLSMGMGIGGHEQYILDNAGDFPLQVIYTGEDVGEINNGYIALLAMVGVPVTLAILLIAALLVWMKVKASPRGAPQYFLWLLLLLPFVDGRIVSPIYFLLVGLFSAGPAVGRRATGGAGRMAEHP